ncbi:DUF58 domain-containing protein [Xanthobacter sp. TB0139]|uniref:DUF58 domain-containing protein n=1 Tax=Xanthobacter sp. TB0139 TaxID=3459178 RepID=UPI00403A010C
MAASLRPHPHYGLFAPLDELIAMQPAEGLGGFAPGGKVRTHQFGGHRSAFRGRGMEFDEVRAYQPGDDIRTIDWRVTARTGRTHTKLFQEERERPVLLLMDARHAMRFGTRERFKSVQAARVAAMLTWVGLAGHDRVGGVLLSPDGLSAYRPERSRRRILHFLKALSQATRSGLALEEDAPAPPSPDMEPDLATALDHLRIASRPGTLIFLISDFDDFNDTAQIALNRLAAAQQVTALFIHDKLEEQLPQRGHFRLSDGEEVALLDAGNRIQHKTWAAHFAARRARVEQFCRRMGIAFLPLRTDEDPGIILMPGQMGAMGSARGRAGRKTQPGAPHRGVAA